MQIGRALLVEQSGGSLPPDVWCSLITVTYNSARTLEEFWGSAGRPPAGVEWIVVDNGSTDDSVAVAERIGATRVITLADNRGFSAANNAGFEQSRGSFIGFLNPDVRVRYEDLASLAAVAEQERAIVAPQLVNADGSLQPNGRGYPYLWDKVRNRLGRSESLVGRYLLFAPTEEPRPVCWLMGAAVFGTRDDIRRFDAWDPHFFLYYEDKDFCLRAWAAGVRVVVTAENRWQHGWARETTGFKLAPWRRELASMAKFYSRYPEFLLGTSRAARKHARIQQEVFGGAS